MLWVIVKQTVNQALANFNTVFSTLLRVIPGHKFKSLANTYYTGRLFRVSIESVNVFVDGDGPADGQKQLAGYRCYYLSTISPPVPSMINRLQ